MYYCWYIIIQYLKGATTDIINGTYFDNGTRFNGFYGLPEKIESLKLNMDKNIDSLFAYYSIVAGLNTG